MCYKLQYKDDLNRKHQVLDVNHFPFQVNDNHAQFRFDKIYKAARSNEPPIGDETKTSIINTLIHIYLDRNEIPISALEYDNYAKSKIKMIAKLIGGNTHNYYIGIGQKCYNLFMKDLWAWDKLIIDQEKVLHFPIDRKINNLIYKSPWKNWTQIVSHDEVEFELYFSEYLIIQNILRNQLVHFNTDIPLNVEQYLWHGFD